MAAFSFRLNLFSAITGALHPGCCVAVTNYAGLIATVLTVLAVQVPPALPRLRFI